MLAISFLVLDRAICFLPLKMGKILNLKHREPSKEELNRLWDNYPIFVKKFEKDVAAGKI